MLLSCCGHCLRKTALEARNKRFFLVILSKHNDGLIHAVLKGLWEYEHRLKTCRYRNHQSQSFMCCWRWGMRKNLESINGFWVVWRLEDGATRCYLWKMNSQISTCNPGLGGTDVEAETPILWPPDAESWLIWKDPDAGKDWGREEKGSTEDEMVGWHHRHNGHGFEQALGVGDGQGGLACCGSWGRKESDMTEWLSWT